MVLQNRERKGKMIKEGRKENECARKRIRTSKEAEWGKEEGEEDRRGMTGNEK